MSDNIDMSLDEIIKMNRGKYRLSRGRGGRGLSRGRFRTGRNSFGRGRWSNRRPRAAGRGRVQFNRGNFNLQKFSPAFRTIGVDSLVRGTTKLLISNLEYGVSDSDIKELFAEFGALRKAVVHYDQSGRSLGTADVVFERRLDAVQAMKQYNGVPLDGRPMKIQITSSFVPRTNHSPGRGNQRIRFLGRGHGRTRSRGGYTRN